jgi:1-acyl-sn-glycerol-3-phosphate acyltransferase
MAIRDKIYDAFHTAQAVAEWFVFAANTSVLGSTAIAVSLLGKGGNLTHHVGRFWGRVNLAFFRGRLQVTGREKLVPDQPYVIMSNHQSHIDILTVYTALPLQIRWVMKQELRKMPIFGYACERMGHIYVQRGNSESARASMAAAARRIAKGTSVVFFPEGTRSRTGRIGRFKTGGFRLAIEAGVPILPVSIWGTRHMLPPNEWKVRSGPIRVTISDPIPTDGLVLEDMADLMARTRKAILAGLPLDADALLDETAEEAASPTDAVDDIDTRTG